MLVIPILLVILCIGICRWAAGRYEAMLSQAGGEKVPTAHTGAEVVRLFLAAEEITDVVVVEHNSTVTDYFDPGRRRLFLSPEVAQGVTMAAWAVALHEAAHATQRGEAEGELKWRQTVIKLTRYGPVFTALAAAALLFIKFPPKLAFMAWIVSCVLFLLLNLGTLAIEFNANARLRRFLEKHLERWPDAREKLQGYLSRVAMREVGDLLRSPRYFFFSALPGSGSSRPER